MPRGPRASTFGQVTRTEDEEPWRARAVPVARHRNGLLGRLGCVSVVVVRVERMVGWP